MSRIECNFGNVIKLMKPFASEINSKKKHPETQTNNLFSFMKLSIDVLTGVVQIIQVNI